jgi:hypothetical protein
MLRKPPDMSTMLSSDIDFQHILCTHDRAFPFQISFMNL